MKYLEITTARAIYKLPLEVVAKHRADYYVKERGANYLDEVKFVSEDDYEGEDWFKNSMNEEDFKDKLILVNKFDDEDFPNAEIDIIED